MDVCICIDKDVYIRPYDTMYYGVRQKIRTNTEILAWPPLRK